MPQYSRLHSNSTPNAMVRRPGTAPNNFNPPTTTTMNPGTSLTVSSAHRRRFSNVKQEINEVAKTYKQAYNRPVTAPLSPIGLDTTSFESFESNMTMETNVSQMSIVEKKEKSSSYRTRSADPSKAGSNRTTPPNSLAGLSDPTKNFERYTPYDAQSLSSSNHNFSGIRSLSPSSDSLNSGSLKSSFKYHQTQEQQTFDRSSARRGQGGELYSWLESTDEEQNQFSSFAIKAESVWLEACAETDYALSSDLVSEPANNSSKNVVLHRSRTAAACEILLNVTEIFGRFKNFLEPVTKEIIRNIYDDSEEILENPRMTRVALQSGLPFHAISREIQKEVDDLRDELNLQNSGVALTEMLQKRNAGIFKVFHKAKLVLRDIIFNVWSQHIKSRKRQLVMFQKRKLGKLFNLWAHNVKFKREMGESSAFQFKKKWQSVEREKMWLEGERDRLLEELEICLMKKGEQGQEVAALYRMLEERSAQHKTHFQDNDSELCDLLSTTPTAAVSTGYIKTAVKQKINHMLETGLLHDIEEQIKQEHEVVKSAARRRTVSEDVKKSGLVGKPAKIAKDVLEAADKRVVDLEKKLQHATELLRKAENEIIELTKDNAEKEGIIANLTPKQTGRRTMNPAAELLGQVKKLETDKECQTPEEWAFTGHLTNKEKKEIAAQEKVERRNAGSLKVGSSNIDSAQKTANEQVREAASKERRRRSSSSMQQFENIAKDLKNRGISPAEIKELAALAAVHPLKGTKRYAMSVGCEGILVATATPEVQVPALSLSQTEEICLQAWVEKLRRDKNAHVSDKLAPLPEMVLDTLVKTHALRSLALKYFRSFLWSLEQYKDRSTKLKMMYELLCLHAAPTPGEKSPKFLNRELEPKGNASKTSFRVRTHSLIGSQRVSSMNGSNNKISAAEARALEEAEILKIYDSAKVQFFFNILKTFFLDPEDMFECLSTPNFRVKKGACEAAIQENFVFLKTKNPMHYKGIFKQLHSLKAGPNKNDRRLHVVFDEVADIFLSNFAAERAASKGMGSTNAQNKALMTMKKLFREAKTGQLAFKIKQMTRLQDAFEVWDKKKNGEKLGGMYTFQEFNELLLLGVGAHDISEDFSMRLFHDWHNQAEQETGWEQYMQAHDEDGGGDGVVSTIDDFKKLSRHVQDRAWQVDERPDEEKRKSILQAEKQTGDMDQRKKDYFKLQKAAARLKNRFFEMNFTSMDKDLARNVEVSRGVVSTKIAFAKVLWRNNIYPAESKVFRHAGDAGGDENSDSSDEDEDYDTF
ncbi:hypothetical protein TrLO_g782 [Triparma laevis f. longispina]|uniref:Uncharacterized protein n=1 Tax=Triparma laevis f. longispina TaxID=1714387 RepID=A0A9W7F2P6_9STRA|nr:hypothetical protein TrLO_g782 [Triparma laevis f. longispina]